MVVAPRRSNVLGVEKFHVVGIRHVCVCVREQAAPVQHASSRMYSEVAVNSRIIPYLGGLVLDDPDFCTAKDIFSFHRFVRCINFAASVKMCSHETPNEHCPESNIC